MELRYKPVILVLAGFIVCEASMVSAQTAPDAIMSAYHDYKAAKERGDLPAAEAAAKRAFAASEARDHGGGVTGVLGMNLADVEIGLGHPEDAVLPARRAVDLSKEGAKGVDELSARLLLAQAELAADPKADEAAAIAALLQADKRGSEIDDYAYPAALALGNAARSTKQWTNMRDAWRIAQHHVGGASGDPAIALGNALTQEAIAELAGHNDAAAEELLTSAIIHLTPAAPERPDVEPTVGEVMLARAQVVRAAERARQKSEGKIAPTSY